MASTSVTVKVAPKVGVGVTTYVGLAATILQAAGAVYAGVKTNDTLAVTAGVGAITTALTTLGGRFAQAVAAIRKAAPLVQAGAAGVQVSNSAPSGDEAELVSDEDEFASPPPDETNTPVQPSQVGLTNDPEA